MKYYFLNPQSCSGLALKKWGKLSNQMLDLNKSTVIDNFYEIDWEKFQISEGDSCISAGGDGTLHCMVNAIIRHKGIAFLQKIRIGHVGLGSNNSFLRPYTDCLIINEVPMKVSEMTYAQDLLEVTIEDGDSVSTIYCVANSSLGFLATANILFNNASDIAILKKWNSDLADVYTFIKALINWKPIKVEVEYDTIKENRSITNMHFMKKPFYATDLGFPEEIPAANGMFRLNILWERGGLTILRKFFSMLVFKDLLQGRDLTRSINHIRIHSKKLIPIELDGEIYYGSEFNIKTYKGGIHLCK